MQEKCNFVEKMWPLHDNADCDWCVHAIIKFFWKDWNLVLSSFFLFTNKEQKHVHLVCVSMMQRQIVQHKWDCVWFQGRAFGLLPFMTVNYWSRVNLPQPHVHVCLVCFFVRLTFWYKFFESDNLWQVLLRIIFLWLAEACCARLF